MRTTTLRTKTVLAALTGAGVLALGTAAALPATGMQDALVRVTSDFSGHQAQSGSDLANGHGPGRVRA